jgi:hydrogenase maturation factor
MSHDRQPALTLPACTPDAHGRCALCADEALTAEVLQVSGGGMALVRIDNATLEVDVTLIDQIAPGDRVLIHGGVALAMAPAAGAAEGATA